MVEPLDARPLTETELVDLVEYFRTSVMHEALRRYSETHPSSRAYGRCMVRPSRARFIKKICARVRREWRAINRLARDMHDGYRFKPDGPWAT